MNDRDDRSDVQMKCQHSEEQRLLLSFSDIF